MTLLHAQRYAVGRALAMVRDRPLAFLLGVLLAASALALPLALASVLWAARPVVMQVAPAPEISVFVSPRAAPQDLEALKARLNTLPGVTGVEIRPKEKALADLIRKSGFATTPAELGANPLPDVLVAQLSLPATETAVDGVAVTAKGWPLVDSVRSDLDWYRKVRAIAGLATTVIAVFGGLVLLLVALILVGTVRLHASTRTDEVEVLELVGATRQFIVRPYAYSAALTLAIASALALAAVLGTHVSLREPIGQLTALYGPPFTLPDPEPIHLMAVFAGSVLLGWLVGIVGARGAISSR